VGQQFDPSKPFTVAPSPAMVGGETPNANESVADAQTRGFKEGVVGGAKGFVDGMLQSPASFAKGIVSLLTTNPATTVKDAIAAIERLPDAIRAAGADPEGWGRSVGDLTGQTMIGAVAPRAVAAGARGAAAVGQGVADAAGAVVNSPLAARVAPKLVKYGTAAAGGAVGGWPGAIVGREVGADLAEGLKARLTAKASALTPAESTLIEGLSTGEPMPAAKFMELLQQVPPDHRAAIMEARQAAVQAGQAGGAAPASPSPVAPAAAEAPPAAAPSAPSAPLMPAAQSAPAAAPEPAPAAPVTAPMSRPAAMQAALKAFAEAQEQPRPAEVSNVAFAIAKGAPPEQALKLVVGNRGPVAAAPAPSPAEAFNAKYGLAQPTVDQTKFPKGMRGAVGSAQSVTVPPAETPTPQELIQGGYAEADFARQYAARQATVAPGPIASQPVAPVYGTTSGMNALTSEHLSALGEDIIGNMDTGEARGGGRRAYEMEDAAAAFESYLKDRQGRFSGGLRNELKTFLQSADISGRARTRLKEVISSLDPSEVKR
jgi:hypothetical protein